MEKIALFAGGALFGSAGLKLLSSKDARKVYAHTTAAALRIKESTMTTVTAVQECAGDILAEAKDINDSPALSAANVGIAISDAAAIAREISDVTIAADNLFELVTLKLLSNALMTRISRNYRLVIGFNGTLIGLGALGVLQPDTSALLHNLSTLAISLKSMTKLLES